MALKNLLTKGQFDFSKVFPGNFGPGAGGLIDLKLPVF